MKAYLLKLKQKFCIHKWVLIYRYGASALFKCKRCKKSDTDFVWNKDYEH
jgi:gamma-glutamylcysteine synthetase